MADQPELVVPTFPDGYEHFSSAYPRTLDDKARVVLPAGEWRSHFESGGKLTVWTGCLALWTRRSYADVCAYLQARVRAGSLDAWVLADFREDAVDVKPDTQGRLSLPDDMRGEVGIGGPSAPVRLIGQGDRIEIWDPERKAGTRKGRPRRAYNELLTAQNY